jgi:hypothetical protein
MYDWLVAHYDTFKDFAAPVATIVVAITAGFITWSYNMRQLIIAQDKLKLDLFKERYALFKSAEELIVLLGQQIGNDQVDTFKIQQLRERTEEMRFFFGAEVQEFRLKLVDLINPLVGVILKLAEQRRQYEAGEQETSELIRYTNQLSEWYKTLPQIFERELGFRQLQ